MDLKKSRCDVPNDTTQRILSLISYNIPHFFQSMKLSNVHNREVKAMCNTRALHNVWLLNNNHPTHKITIVCIVNQNLYHICGHYICYGILNVTMDMNSCNGCFKKIYWRINCLLKNCAFTRKPNTHLMMFHSLISFQPSIMMKQPYFAQDA
jgi:hypothetical protein